MVAIEESMDLTTLSIDEVFGSLYHHQERLNKHNGNSLENAFKAQITFGRGGGRGNSRFRGRGRGRYNFQKEEGKSPNPRGRRNQYFNSRGCNKTNVKCYYFKKFKHFENECREKQAYIQVQKIQFFFRVVSRHCPLLAM